MRAARSGLALVLALGSLACGGGDDEPASPTPSVPEATPSTTVADAGEETTTSPPPALGDVTLQLTQIATLEAPTAMALRAGDDRLYLADRRGEVVRLPPEGGQGEVVLDFSERVSTGGERGFLGLAFPPAGDRLYASYTNPDGDSRIDRYEVASDGSVDAGSRREVLAQEQPFPNHNGGNAVVGPDGFLWFGLGDGGSQGDPTGTGQDPSDLLGSLLRIDPESGDPYAIPEGNPFAEGGGAPEVWLYGTRNPWRFSFDRETGDLWVADVGGSQREEITVLPAEGGTGAGANLGWNVLEGSAPLAGDEPPPGYVGPVFEYPRGENGGCAVTGGYVYRGSRIPGLVGAYLFTDACDSELRAVVVRDGVAVEQRRLGVGAPEIVSFGEDAAGELYALSLQGGVYRIDPG